MVSVVLGVGVGRWYGVGLLKKKWLAVELEDVSVAVQAALKNTLDPTGILNPAKVFDAASRPDARQDH